MSFLTSFDVFPAIDLLDGNSVRLRKGERSTAEVVHPDPLEQLRQYAEAGARWVHIVNLNAAFGDSPGQHQGATQTLQIIERLARHAGVRIQLGGGIRSSHALEQALSVGASRVVVGTWALSHFAEVMKHVEKDAERIVIGVDSVDDHIAVHGWTEKSSESTLSFAKRLKSAGVQTVLFTEIERDGMLSGAAVEKTADLATHSGLQVIASGGVRDLSDVQKLSQKPGVCGVITGRALAQGTLTLRDALSCARHI